MKTPEQQRMYDHAIAKWAKASANERSRVHRCPVCDSFAGTAVRAAGAALVECGRCRATWFDV